jgi:Zn-dependent membrane protease YugP
MKTTAMKPNAHGLIATLNAGEKLSPRSIWSQLSSIPKKVRRLLPKCFFLSVSLGSFILLLVLVLSVSKKVTWLGAIALSCYVLFVLLGALLSLAFLKVHRVDKRK